MIPYLEDFLTQAEADDLFACVKTLTPVREKNKRNSNTLIRKLHYGTYSPFASGHGYGQSLDLGSAPDEIKSLAAKLTAYAGETINYLSVLGYENEKDHINFHTHKEDHAREDMSVWVLSLGQIRELAIRPISSKDESQYEYLYPVHGSLYVLPSSYNDTHEHAILDQDFPCSLRISINCKHIPPPPPKQKKVQAASPRRIPTFGYPGSKARLARRIAAMLPPTGKRYVEPFAGRANVYFAVAQLLHYEQFWLNDLQIASFLESLQLGMGYAGFNWEIPANCRDVFDTFRDEFCKWKLSDKDEAAIEEGVRAMLELFPDPQSIQKALDRTKCVIPPSPYLVEPYLCFSGGTYRSGRRTTEKNAPSREGFERNVRLASEIMRRTRPQITRRDYKNVLADCVSDDVVYLDPPYLKAKVTAYSDKTLNHAEMVDILLNAKFRWLLSEYENPVYKPLGEPVLRIQVQRAMANSSNGSGKPLMATECLWKNF